MKNIFIALISIISLGLLGGCYKTCEEPFAPNYTMEGSCIDLTVNLIGNYNGQLVDSIVGLHSTTSSATLQITKVDDGHVNIASSTATSFITYQAAVSSSANGYYLAIPAQTSSGLTVSGAGTYFNAIADGVYTTSGKQLTIYSLAGTRIRALRVCNNKFVPVMA